MALHNYHDVFLQFPFSSSHDGGGGTNADPFVLNHTGWLMLLPYLDQAPLYNKLDLNQATGNWRDDTPANTNPLHGNAANGNDALIANILQVFRCPSDIFAVEALVGSANYGTGTAQAAALTNYGFSVQSQTFDGRPDWDSIGSRFQHMFGANNSARIRDITDGTSNTVAVVETLRGILNGKGLPWGTCDHTGRGGVVFDKVGTGLGAGINNWVCCPWPTAAPVDSTNHIQLADNMSPGSLHRGGCHVLMGDGAVRFISENVFDGTRTSLSSIAGDEVLGEF